MKLISAVAASAILLVTSISFAGPLGAAGDYNLFIFNDVNHASDTQGRVAVGGNATFNSYSIADQLAAGSYNSLVVGGNLNFVGGQIYHGNVFVGGNATLTNGLTITEGSLTVGGNLSSNDASPPPGGVFVHGTTSIPAYWSSTHLVSAPASPIDFAAEASSLKALSLSWSGIPITGSTALNFSTLTLAGANPNLNVFFVSAADLGPATAMNINVPAGSTVLINVDGTTVNFDNIGIATTSDAAHTLYNFYQATTLNISSINTLGTVFAPLAAVNGPSGLITGELIADSLTGGIQINVPTFGGELPPGGGDVPEPASLSVLAIGAVSLLMRSRR